MGRTVASSFLIVFFPSTSGVCGGVHVSRHKQCYLCRVCAVCDSRWLLIAPFDISMRNVHCKKVKPHAAATTTTTRRHGLTLDFLEKVFFFFLFFGVENNNRPPSSPNFLILVYSRSLAISLLLLSKIKPKILLPAKVQKLKGKWMSATTTTNIIV